MVELTAGVLQAGLNVLGFKIGQFFQHLLRGQPVGQQVEHVHHADAHPTDAGASAAQFGVNCDAIHGWRLPQCRMFCTAHFPIASRVS
jgi:hypothetical protein